MRYLFHNIYGDADDLIASAPDDVQVQSFGWDIETETARNQLLNELQTSVSSLPSVLYWFPEHTIPPLVEGEDRVVIPARYAEIRLSDLEKPWSWALIDSEIERRINEATLTE